MSAWGAFCAGLATIRRVPALPALLLAVNLAVAALVVVPFGAALERGLKNTGAASSMLYGFDYDFWSLWSERATSFLAAFNPDMFGAGFVPKNLELLARGELPGRLFARGGEAAGGLDPLLLGLGAAYVALNVFLSGGVLSVLRAPRGGLRARAFWHACGFYAGRLARLALLGLVLFGLVYAVDTPIATWLRWRAYEAVDERTAIALSVLRHVLLFSGLLAVFTLASYAKVILVLEERRSALLALVSAAGFLWRHKLRAAAHVALVLLCGLAAIALWSAFDALWPTVGYRTQIVTFAGMQLLMYARLGLRLALLAGQVELYRASTR